MTAAFVDVDPCPGSRLHRPRPLRLVNHHIVPLGWGGRNTLTNTERCCDLCHYGIHAVLEAFRRAGRELTPAETRKALGLPRLWPLSRYCYALAVRGWRMTAAARGPGVSDLAPLHVLMPS